MPETIGEAFVAVRPDTTGFAAETQRSVQAAGDKAGTKAGKSMGQKMGRSLSGGLTSFLGGAVVGLFVKDAINAANDIAESQNKLAAVFGKKTGEMKKHYSGLIADILGSTKLTTDAAGSFGNLFTQMGLGKEQAVKFSKGMLTLTADLVSFHNADPTQVVEAIGAAFRGEYDSVQRYIPTITAAAVENRALADSGKLVASELTPAEKAAATYALMMEGAGKATGDAAKTADSAANQQRKLKRRMEDTSVSIGQALQPAMAIIVPMVASLAQAFADAEPWIQKATLALIGFGVVAILLGGWVGLIVFAIGALIIILGVMWAKWDEIWTWMKEHPAYAAIIVALNPIYAFLFLLVWAAKNFKEKWDGAWAEVSSIVSVAWQIIQEAWDTVGQPVFDSVIGAINWVLIFAGVLKNAWDGIFDGIKAAWNGVKGVVDGIIDTLKRLIDLAKTAAEKAGDIGGGFLDFVDPAGLVHKKKAAGGPVGPGLHLVGEKGPELLHLAGHGRIDSAVATAAKLGGRGGGLVIENATFGDRNVIADLDYWTMTRLSGV